MVFNSIKKDILRKLQMEFPNMYTDSNLLLSATHTHSGPGGFSDNDLFNVTAPYDRQNFDIISEGIFQSIRQAHLNLAFGEIHFEEGDLLGAAINRSPYAYRKNPTGKTMLRKQILQLVLRFSLSDGRNIGMLNWFAVHPLR